MINIDLIKEVLEQRNISAKAFMEVIFSKGCKLSLSYLNNHQVQFEKVCKIADYLGVTTDALRPQGSCAASSITGSYNNNSGSIMVNDFAVERNALKTEIESLKAIIKEKENSQALYERLLEQLSARKDESIAAYEHQSN